MTPHPDFQMSESSLVIFTLSCHSFNIASLFFLSNIVFATERILLFSINSIWLIFFTAFLSVQYHLSFIVLLLLFFLFVSHCLILPIICNVGKSSILFCSLLQGGYLRDIVGSFSDHHNKVNITIMGSHEIFDVLVYVKVMFTLYWSLLSMQ